MHYYQRNKFVDFKSNILFHELLDTSDSEFEDWAKTLRKEVTEQWDEFGNPPVIGKNHDKIITSLGKLKSNSLFILMSRAAVVNFKDLINRVKKGDIYVATDVFPEEPVKKKDPIRKVKNFLFSAHRAGALKDTFTEWVKLS